MSDLLGFADNTRSGGAYTVLARRYRSRTFEELIGQESIARTLMNAIELGRTAHAYLFCGTRGVGKTSMARIFAKAMNAVDTQKEKRAVGDAILRGEDIDVIEIDAASNTGVDHVRDLIANAALMPARSPYKIYIIDEVHMLSGSAFNALLKIMEEPPSHVKFILCTTEVHKVPATIQSRCQRFDFRNIPTADIARHITEVLKRENVKADVGVVREISRLASGSMRDGLSLLDRLIAAGGDAITEEVLRTTLGTPDHALVARVMDAVVEGDPRGALEAADALLNSGVSIEFAIESIVEHLRSVLVLASCGAETPLVEVFGAAREAGQRHAAAFDVPSIVYMIMLCEGMVRSIKTSSTPRPLFDALIARLALSERLASIPALLRGDSRGAGAAGTTEKKKPQPPAGESLNPAPPRTGPATAASAHPQPQPPGRSQRAHGAPNAPAGSSAAAPANREPDAAQVEALSAHPLVAKTLELFNGRIVAVRDIAPTAPEEPSDV